MQEEIYNFNNRRLISFLYSMDIVRGGWIFIELCLLRVSIFFHDLPENTSTRRIRSVITLTKTRDTPTGKCEDRLTRSNHRQL